MVEQVELANKMSSITVDKVYKITEWVYQRKTKWINPVEKW